MKRVLSVVLVTLLLVHLSFTNQAAIGSYSRVENTPSGDAPTTVGALPAVAAVAIGVSVVAAFAYGVYTGYRDAAGEAFMPDTLENASYDKMDFSKFDA